MRASNLVAGILRALETAEKNERNPHLCDDYRISWITVVYAHRELPDPHVAATYQVLGLHPAKVWTAIIERRKAKLGKFYDAFFGENLPPKKPVQSVRPTVAMVGRKTKTAQSS